MAKAALTQSITHAVVRMYCMGTGDCFIVKFFKGEDNPVFTLMIDCGVWTGKKTYLRPFMQDLKAYTGGKIDLLVVTHEHKDHVSVFEACEDVFATGFSVKRTWMAWTENDKVSKVKYWKTKYGEKAKSLAMAAEKLSKNVNSQTTETLMMQGQQGKKVLASKKHFAKTLLDFTSLSMMSIKGQYIGTQEGMRIAKKVLGKNKVEFKNRGDIIEDLPGAEGIKFYVLGPPETYDEVKTEGGGEGESYTHNTILKEGQSFAAAIQSKSNPSAAGANTPFDAEFECRQKDIIQKYKSKKDAWRSIENDWLYSAGALALRMSTLTNNLSLALAIEFAGSKRVMLFPGDAEYGSWASWHEIDWKGKVAPDGGHFTKDLLNRTVFYKVAHHMSHNGTARRLGLDMMTHKDLAAMATLDYDVIADDWPNTMPNIEIVEQLLRQGKGRLMIMNETDVLSDREEKIPIAKAIKTAMKKMSSAEKAAFDKSYYRHPDNMYVEYKVMAK